MAAKRANPYDYYPYSHRLKKTMFRDPVGNATVKDFRQGEVLKVKGSNKVYIRGAYERSLKKYELIDAHDMNRSRFVKGSMLAHDNFEY